MLHERLQIAERGIKDLQELVSQKRPDASLIEGAKGGKSPFISSVAGAQLGAQNYRKKNNKRGKGSGLSANFEFKSDKAAASLNRIMGNQRNIKNGQTLLNVHMEPLRESDREQTVLASKDTDLLVNMSTQHRELQLSIGGNIQAKRRASKQ